MTIRYVAIKPRMDYDDWAAPRLTMQVVSDEATPQPTGLLNANGVPLYRVSEGVHIGFQGKGSRL